MAPRLMAALLASCLLLSAAASAEISRTGSQAMRVSAPDTVQTHDNESDEVVIGFDERQDVLLEEPVQVQLLGMDGEYIAPFIEQAVIEAGTVVDSHYLHFDPLESLPESEAITLTARFRFDGQVLGVIAARADLEATDVVLGLADTAYPPIDDPDFGADDMDSITIEDGRERVVVTFTAWSGADNVRVLTAPGTARVDGGMPPDDEPPPGADPAGPFSFRGAGGCACDVVAAGPPTEGRRGALLALAMSALALPRIGRRRR